MRNQKIIFMLGLALFCSCKNLNSGGSTTNGAGTSTNISALYLGHWLSDCVNLGGGLINRIYLEINADETIDVAILAYASSNCSSTHVLKNAKGATITAPEYAQNFAEQTVTKIPSNFYVLGITTIANSATQYVVMFVNDHDFYQLSGFANPHDTWNSWQGEADVSQFATNPTTYSPNTAVKYHFTKSELP